MRNKDYQVPHLSTFPPPFPDETAYSLLTRFHLRSGMLTVNNTLDLLFGNHNMQMSADFPSFIPQLAQASRLSTDEFIASHTIAPFFRPFKTPVAYKKLVHTLASGEGYKVIAQLSLIANRIITEPHFKYCEGCVREDRTLYGVGYWHREHQLPGVSCCLKHASTLQEHKKYRKKLILPPTTTNDCMPTPSFHEVRYTTLASACLADTDTYLSEEKLHQTYLFGLKNKGFLTSCGRIRMHDFKIRLRSFWSGLLDQGLFRQLNPIDDTGNYPDTLFYNKSSSYHPIKHFLLIGFLFENWEGFLEQYNSEIRAEDSIRPEPSYSDPLAHKKQQARALLHTGKSLRYVAKNTGLSVGTIRALAEQERVPIKTRPKSIYAFEQRAIWRKLMIGQPSDNIAKVYNISTGAVEQILRSHPYLVPLRKKIRFRSKQIDSRSALELFLNSGEKVSRKDIQKEMKGRYTWLYRHDKKWLYSNIPEKQPYTYHPRKSSKTAKRRSGNG